MPASASPSGSSGSAGPRAGASGIPSCSRTSGTASCGLLRDGIRSDWFFGPWIRLGGYCQIGEHTSELQSPCNLVCRLLLEKKKKTSQLKQPAGSTHHSVEASNY